MRASPPPSGDGELRAWLALSQVPGLSIQRLHSLLPDGASPETLLAMGVSALRAAGLSERGIGALRKPDWAAVDAALAWLDSPGRSLLHPAHPAYPPLLLEIPDPPVILYVQGDPAVLALPQIAIVGSRNPTAGGRDTAFAFASALARCGLVITSGLAAGVDAESHRGALHAPGCTIAVAGNGLDIVYPAANRGLAREILEQGAVVSEFAPGTKPHARNFPRRNRIISGLSIGVLVVEAARRSGSLITARLAGEQGREVFAIPGSIHNPLARGCHRLIREGAKLVECVDDVLEELTALLPGLDTAGGVPPAAPPPPESEALGPDAERFLESLGYDPATVDGLVERTGLTAEAVSSMLLTLELQGHVETLPGGAYVRARHRKYDERKRP